MNFLLLTKEYPPEPNPSGQIVEYLAKELLQRGHCVDVITQSQTSVAIEQSDNYQIHSIKPTRWNKLLKRVTSREVSVFEKIFFKVFQLVRKILLIFQIHRFPDSEPQITQRYVNCYMNLSQYRKYDVVISFFRPYSCLAAGMQIKKREPRIKLVSYYFDLVEDKDCPSLMPIKLYRELIIEGDKRVIKQSDLIVLPAPARQVDYYSQAQWLEKALFCEFPTYIHSPNVPSNHQLDVPGDKKSISFVFAGTLDSSFRNPLLMLSSLKRVSEELRDKRIILDIFGTCNCLEVLHKFDSDEHYQLRYHGRVPKAEVRSYEEKADFLVNITNNYKGIVPSKIFELFALGKPIVNFVPFGDDGSQEYFQKYPCVLNVNADQGSGAQKKLRSFICENAGKAIDVTNLDSLFERCTPQYVVTQMMRGLQEDV